MDAVLLSRRSSPDLTAAREHLLAAARHDPDDVHNLLLLGSVALATGDLPEVVEAVGAARPADRAHAEMLATLFACLTAFDPGTPDGRRLSMLRAAVLALPSLMRGPVLLALGNLLTTLSDDAGDLAEGVDLLVELMEQSKAGDPEYVHAMILVTSAMCRHLTIDFAADLEPAGRRPALGQPRRPDHGVRGPLPGPGRARAGTSHRGRPPPAQGRRGARPDDREKFLLAGAGLALFYDRFVAKFALEWLNDADRCCDILEALPYTADVSAMRRRIAEQRSA